MNRYEDMLYLPHPVSPKRARMANADRAAQFSSFDALTGLDVTLAEAGRRTQASVELTESALEELDAALRELQARIREQPRVCLTCFFPDTRKEGGAWHQLTGEVERIDLTKQCLTLCDGTHVPLSAVFCVQMLQKQEPLA
jgi:hypothetical protein